MATAAAESPTGDVIQSWVSSELRASGMADPATLRSTTAMPENKGSGPALHCECLPKDRPSMNNGKPYPRRYYRKGSCNWLMLGLLRQAGGFEGLPSAAVLLDPGELPIA